MAKRIVLNTNPRNAMRSIFTCQGIRINSVLRQPTEICPPIGRIASRKRPAPYQASGVSLSRQREPCSATAGSYKAMIPAAIACGCDAWRLVSTITVKCFSGMARRQAAAPPP